MNPNFTIYNDSKKNYIIQMYQQMRQMEPEIKNQMRTILRQKGVYHQMNVNDIPKKVLFMTVGKNGINFKKITERNNLFSIWYSVQENLIELWGEQQNIQRTIRQLSQNIDKNMFLHKNYPGYHLGDVYNQNNIARLYPNLVNTHDEEFHEDAEQWYAHTCNGEDCSELIGAYKETWADLVKY